MEHWDAGSRKTSRYATIWGFNPRIKLVWLSFVSSEGFVESDIESNRYIDNCVRLEGRKIL